MGTAGGEEPVQQAEQVLGHGRERPLLLLDRATGRRAQSAGLDLLLMHIDAAATSMNYLNRIVRRRLKLRPMALLPSVQMEWPLPQILLYVLVAQTEVLAATQVRLTNGLAAPRQCDLLSSEHFNDTADAPFHARGWAAAAMGDSRIM